ncbi:MAG: LmbE family N-acetylglucosaminyl deacetylase [Candidatus Azotimanducaceae bacterium]|jgi:LmbE family N-acetylglucosaminyl deacetylase
MIQKISAGLLILLVSATSLVAQQPQKPTASEIYHELQNLNFIGSALYIAAHPDDENTRLISYLANDIHARTAYLSLTRGDGGQNLVGPEIRELLGVIRTQELLAARRTDGGSQLFTRANDFGYSKHPDETLAIWEKDEVLSDVVRAIRQFKPDIIINRFDHRTPGQTHGHHTSSAMLGFDAFDLVGNAAKFPTSAATFGAWQPTRLFMNTSWWFYGSRENFEKADKTNLIEVETGNYYPALGLSNGEIASLSRSMHKSQGFGSTGSRGNETEYLEFLKGVFPQEKTNPFSGINTTWSRLVGGKAIGAILTQLEQNFDFKNPSTMVGSLMQAYQLISNLEDTHWRAIKLSQIEQLIIDCSGLYIEAVADTQSINTKGRYNVTFEAVNRGSVPFNLQSIRANDGSVILVMNEPLTQNKKFNYPSEMVSKATATSAPYWLQEEGSLGMYKVKEELIGLPETPVQEQVVFNLQYRRMTLPITRNVIYKYNDPVDGEVYQPLEIVPEVSTSIADKVLIFASSDARQIAVKVRAGRDNVNGFVQLGKPEGWTVSPAQQSFTLTRNGEEQTVVFTVTPPENQSEGYLEPLAVVGDRFYTKELVTIGYNHIPYQSVLLPSKAKVARLNIKKKGELIGYINGAGDAIPESLRQIGYTVITIEPTDISVVNLKKYDAVVMGIRAYNTVEELAFKQDELNKYVEQGGTLLLQYNTSHRMKTQDIAPFSLKLSRDRVTDEFSQVDFLAPKHSVLNTPNKITQEDFKGWVQERGLYFPNEWDDAFTPILGMHDKDYPQTEGSLLVASFGKGHYIYTGLSFFRELPAGVPGAYRLFANLLSIE